MNTQKRTVVALLSALFMTVGAFAPGYAAQTNPPPMKAPTGADCQRIATAAAEKVKANGGTAQQQQAAYSQAKMKCQGKM
ncbi:MAG: hypothetical protein HOP35_05655 [Nitrospira sp.]|nr:hypothetical protein [Nitrospira sp.]